MTLTTVCPWCEWRVDFERPTYNSHHSDLATAVQAEMLREHAATEHMQVSE